MKKIFYKAYEWLLRFANNFKTEAHNTHSFAPSQFFQRIYLTHIANALDSRFPDGKTFRILDAGCGDGRICIALAKQGHDVVGVDSSKTAIRNAHANAAGLDASLMLVDSELRQYLSTVEDDHFEVVICFEVLSHCVDYREILQELRRVLKPGGLLFITLQPPYYYITTLLRQKKFDAALDVAENSEGLLRVATAPAYYNWQVAGEMEQLHVDAGLTLVDSIPIGKYCGYDRDGIAGIVDLEAEDVSPAYPLLYKLEMLREKPPAPPSRHVVLISTKDR